MTNKTQDKDKQSTKPVLKGIDKIRSLGTQIEEFNNDPSTCRDKGCDIGENYRELLKCAKDLLEETIELFEEKNKSLYSKSLVIRQLQQLKKKDDREIILHRERLVNCLDMTYKLERLLKNYDIKFVNKTNHKMANRTRIRSLIEGDAWNKRNLDCEVCGRIFEEKIASNLHSALLFCNHDMTTNLSIKKHLSNKKDTWQDNSGVRLTGILNNIDQSIKRSYSESLRTW